MLPRVDLIRADESSWLLMQTPDWITNSIKKNGNWSSNESNLCKAFTTDMAEPVVIDVGANQGIYSLAMAKIVKPRGKVIAVEPFSSMTRCLKNNMKIKVIK